MTTLNTTDIRAVLDGAQELLEVGEQTKLPAAMLDVASRLVGCDSSSYNELDLATGSALVLFTGPPPDPDSTGVFAAHAAENPLVAHQQATGDTQPLRISDFLGAREFRRRPIYRLIYRELGVEHQLALGVAGTPGRVIGIALNREGRDFSDRDVAVMAMLRPLLDQIRAAIAGPEPANATRGSLTPRQREILALVARGATNAEIAHRLQIRDKTVAKHLEHAYRTLGVGNRTAAAALWLSSST